MSIYHVPSTMWNIGDCECPRTCDDTSMHGEVGVYHTPECIELAKTYPNVASLRSRVKELEDLENKYSAIVYYAWGYAKGMQRVDPTWDAFFSELNVRLASVKEG
jgi:hypothetical protein